MDALKSAAELYGRALAEIAAERGEIEAVVKDLEAAGQAFALPEVELFFASPLMLRQAKLDLIGRVFAGRTTTTFHCLLKVVVSRRRERLLPGIVQAGLRACLASQGIKVVQVTTSMALSPDQEAMVREKLETFLEAPIYPEFRVNPNILGGVVIREGDRLLDASVLGILRCIGELLAAGIPTGQG